MDSLCFKTGVPRIPSSGAISVTSSQNPSGSVQVCPVGKGGGGSLPANANGISIESPTAQTSVPLSSSRYFFTYPLRSLWPGGRKKQGDVLETTEIENSQEAAPVLELGTDGEIFPQECGETETGIGEEKENERADGYFKNRGSWVLKILHVRSLWKDRKENLVLEQESDEDVKNKTHCSDCEEESEEGCCSVDEEASCSSDGEIPIANVQYDRDSFSRLLRRVSLVEAKLYAQMSYLGNLAYSIPQIKPGHLMKYQGLRFITSSLEKKAQAAAATEKGKETTEDQEREKLEKHVGEDNGKIDILPSTAYQIAAAAASYVRSQTRTILAIKSTKTEYNSEGIEVGIRSPSTEVSSEGYGNNVDTGLDLGISSSPMESGKTNISSSEMASFVATTNSVTAVVAAKEETRQAVAKNLNSVHSSPCEWFICDDELNSTRFFVIQIEMKTRGSNEKCAKMQGSETLASWQANLLFEPIKFEGLDVLVHRGIYEAAKGIYEQMLPEVRLHIKSHGESSMFRFTGHSLGGSLSLLVNLMLLIRGEVPKSSLLPVITFGSPCIMCGGDYLLRKLDLPRSHVQAITMHRDIVPRAFSCIYPDRVADLLKVVNSNFRKHPCLKNQKLLYAPMGELLILQPEEHVSPHHHLLPSGSGLYLLDHPGAISGEGLSHLKAAQVAFFNSPHPLEILSDPAAYGSDGAIGRDHDMTAYMRTVRAVIRKELKLLRKANREQRQHAWWPLVAPQGLETGVVADWQPDTSIVVSQPKRQLQQHRFLGVVRSGRESLRRFGRLIASQHVHMLVVFLLPARLLVLGTFTVAGSL